MLISPGEQVTIVSDASNLILISHVALDASLPTSVNSKTNLHRGDLFVISLNDDDDQKLLMEVDEERAANSPNPGRNHRHPVDLLMGRNDFSRRNSH